MPLGPGVAAIGALGILLAFVTIYVLSSNTISERKAKLAAVQQQLTTVQAQATGLQKYTQFVQLAQQRATTVRSLASSRFDWKSALEDLSRVLPAGTSLQSLLATVAPGVSVSGPGGGSSGGSATTAPLRGDITAPAFEMRGCTRSQDEVARVMSRLRLIDGVTRVTLADAQKGDSAEVLPSANQHAMGCPTNHPTFDLVVFFAPLPGASASPTVAGAPGPGSTSTLPASATATTTTTTTPTTSAPASSTPVTGGSK